MFERPVQAAAFALAYQRALRELATDAGQALRARVGIHVGEVMAWQNSAEDIARGAKPIEVEGLAKPVAARLMGLALPGQVLLSAQLGAGTHRTHTKCATRRRLRPPRRADARPGGAKYRWGEQDLDKGRSSKAHGDIRKAGQ